MNQSMVSPAKSPARSLPTSKVRVIILGFLGILLVVLLVTWLNLPWRPDVKGLPPDSGFYAYIGKALLHGQILYRDVWDDKPPLGYYLDAAALGIFGQNPWGLWWSGVIWISACVLLFFVVIKKLFGGLTAGLASVLFLLALMNGELFQGSNMMEVYALAPQVALIGITYHYFKDPRKSWVSALVGVLTAATYLIKQPTIVLGFASIFIMLANSFSQWRIREALLTSLRFVLGFAALLALAASYWLAVGALGDFIEGALLQGFSFIGGSQSRLREYFFYALVNVLPNLYIGGLYLVAMLSGGIFLVERLYRVWLKPVLHAGLSWLEWLVFAAFLLFPLAGPRLFPGSYFGKFWLISIFALGLLLLVKYYRLPSRPEAIHSFTPLDWVWMIAIIALPFEVLMASLGGRYFGHYFITMIPAVTLAVAYPIWRVISGLRSAPADRTSKLSTAMYLIPLILAVGWGVSSFRSVVPTSKSTGNITAIFKNQSIANDLEKYVTQTTQPDDEVLIWHIHLGIDFVTNRKAPSRVLYPLNLFIPPSSANTRLQEYVDDLEAKPPKLILVQRVSSLSLPFVDQPIDQSCDTYCTPEFVQALEVPQIYQQWQRFQAFFYSNYTLDTTIYDWKVYRRLP